MIVLFNMERDRIRYYKLQRKKNLDYEREYQLKLIESNPDYSVFSVINHQSEIVILYGCNDDSFIVIKCRIITVKGIKTPEPRLLATYDKESNLITAGDLQVFGKNKNKGYGTLLIDELKNIARERKAKGINGNISEVDMYHIDRLLYFYKKNCFVVDMNSKESDCYCGSVFWETV